MSVGSRGPGGGWGHAKNQVRGSNLMNVHELSLIPINVGPETNNFHEFPLTFTYFH